MEISKLKLALSELSLKKCSKCLEIKDYKDFPPDKRKLDGLSYHCRLCNSKASKLSNRKVRATPDGKAKTALAMKKYQATPKGRAQTE